jgi:formylglycine-generating enzyme required for sulfatase activity
MAVFVRKKTMPLTAPEFQWIEIPAGKMTLVNEWYDDSESYLKKDQPVTFDVPAFAIAKYPVTNAQFALFVAADGYNQPQWWTEAGWALRESYGWWQPRYANSPRLNNPAAPVVGISWYEACAFCQWLTHNLKNHAGDEGKFMHITLPTDQQWQRAAQATPDGAATDWKYVWGNDWATEKCNHVELPNRQTTPVIQYEVHGNVSPCGVVDMVGNVFEWCATNYSTGDANITENMPCVIRGGSHSSYLEDLWITSRNRLQPAYDNHDIGMRCVMA